MTYSVYQHWDPLETCIVGRSYPPEFYSWIKVPHVRNLFERIAQETEEDFVNIIQKLKSFGVQVLRPTVTEFDTAQLKFPNPPMTPRDSMVMIGEKFYTPKFNWKSFYESVKDPSWQWYDSWKEFQQTAPDWQVQELQQLHRVRDFIANHDHRYQHIVDHVRAQGNQIVPTDNYSINGAMVSRIGRDLYFGTNSYDENLAEFKTKIDLEFPNNRNHVVNTGGHADGTFCPVCPGLIVSLYDVPTYADTFPGWEVVYLPGQSWSRIKPFLDLKQQNRGRWWIPGFEYDQSVIDVVENWLGHWVGYVEETVFDVNMLMIDPKNVMVFNENEEVFRAFDRYGITPHVVPFRHRYFWDGGIHCVTLDLNRRGVQQDYFPGRQSAQKNCNN